MPTQDVLVLVWNRRSSKLGGTVAFAHIQPRGALSGPRLLRLLRLLRPRCAFATRGVAFPCTADYPIALATR
jgi:hypothetical protein